MRILYVLHCYMPDSTGGTEVHVNLLARALSQENEVAICFRVARPGAVEFSIERGTYDGVPTFGIVNNYSWSKGPEQAFRCEAIESSFETVLDAFRPDIVHFNHLGELSTTLPSVVRARCIPSLLTLHDFWYMCLRSYLMTPRDELCDGPRGGSQCGPCWDHDHAVVATDVSGARLARIKSWGLGGTLRRVPGVVRSLLSAGKRSSHDHLIERDAHFRQVLGSMDALLAPSRFLRDRTALWAELPGRIEYVPNGVNPEHLVGVDLALPNGPQLQIGFVGTVSHHKGASVLVDAMNDLAGAPVNCRIYGAARPGDEAYVTELRERCTNPAVRFMGRVPNTEIGQVLSALDVLVVPSIWWENCPMTILEAQFARRPVIATGIGGMAELVCAGENGLTFPPGDAKALATAIGRLVADRELLLQLQSGIVAPPTMDDVARRVYARYQSLLDNRQRGADS